MHYVGCDVSKLKLDFCLLTETEEKDTNDRISTRSKSRSKTVANTVAGIEEFVHWLQKHVTEVSCAHVAMEGTGVYHETAAHTLVKHGVIVSVCNPAQTKSFGKGIGVQNKTDSIDSYVLACFCQKVNPMPWTPPSPEAYTLAGLIARIDAITCDLVREQNRAEKADAKETPTAVVDSINDSIAFLKEQLATLQKRVDDHIAEHAHLKRDMDLLTSIPSIGKRVGAAILALGAVMRKLAHICYGVVRTKTPFDASASLGESPQA